MDIFNLEKHFAFYGAYHHNPINILIHMIFVWPILFTALMLAYYANLGLITTLVYALFYVGMDKKVGLLGAILCFLSWFGASKLALLLGFALTWKVVLVAQLLCWTAQFVGHGVFEALQHFVGYEPYPGFHAKVKAIVEANIKGWEESKKKKS